MKRAFILILVVAAVCFVLFRVVLPFPQVFTDHGVQLNTVDAYYFVRYAEIYPNWPQIDYFMGYPQGSRFDQVVYPAILAFGAVMLKISPLMAAAIMPPFFFLLTLSGIYLVAHRLFQDKMIAATSVLLATVMPGEFMHRTMLGAGDRHALEIMLITWFMAFVFMMIRQVTIKNSLVDYKAIIYMAAASLVGLFYLAAWQGAVIVWGILIGALYIYLATVSWQRWQFWAITGFLGIMAISAVSQIHYLNTMLNFQRDAREAQPLFFTQGQFDMTYMAMWYGMCLFLFMLGLGILVYKYQRDQYAGHLVFITWGLVMVVLTMLSRRWGYYLAINVIITVAFLVWALLPLLNKRMIYRYLAIIGVIVLLPLGYNSTSVAAGDQGYMPQEWQECCAFLRDRHSSSTDLDYYSGSVDGVNQGVLCEWSYGYWVVQQGRMPAYATPGNQREWLEDDLLDARQIRYIITDNKTYDYPVIWGSQEGLRIYERY